jgi:hypothetical protein
MARPRVKLRLISSFLRERERATAREVAYGLQMSIPDATWHLHQLQRLGEASVIERTRVAHATRPVAVYGPAQAVRAAIFSDDWLRGR